MKNSKPSVLVIDEDFALTQHSGKRIRTSNLLKACAPSFSVTYVAYAGGEEEAAEADKAWGPLGVTTIPVQRPRVNKSGAGQLITAAQTLGRRDPVSVAAWKSKRFSETVSNLLQTGRFDLVHCEITQMAWAVPFDAGVPTTLNAHNVESIILERLAEVRRGPLKWLFRDQSKKMYQFESSVLPRFDKVICVSNTDRDRMRDRYGISKSCVVTNGADLTGQPLPPSSSTPILLYPGALDWRPAQDGAAFLLNEILPLVKRRRPDVKVAIVGKSPPKWLDQLCAETPGVVCHSNVPEMEPYYQQAWIVVVPLRVGSGSRLKILEALAYGRAVVSTSVGAEGLALKNRQHVIRVDGAAGFAEAVCDLLDDEFSRTGLERQGRKAVEEQYNWKVIGAEMVGAWRSALPATGVCKI